MPDPAPAPPLPPRPPSPGFPYLTFVATLLGLFLFVGLVMLAYNPEYLAKVLGSRDTEPAAKTDPAERLRAIRAKNQAALAGKDQLPLPEATAAVIAEANGQGKLPFPAPPPPAAAPDKK